MNEVNLIHMGERARLASRAVGKASHAVRTAALEHIATALEQHRERILEANALDVAEGRENGLSESLLDRLNLSPRLTGIIADVRQVAQLEDPIGARFDQRVLENGLHVSRVRVPIGVFGVIYEARPNVTVDVAALTIKTGNATILRGGKETLRSNMVLVEIMRQALIEVGLPADVIQYIESTDRRYIGELLKLHEYVDIIVPRGGEALHRFCRENSTIPVITGGIGICHIYVDETADFDKALSVIHNAKTNRPSVCNSLDTVLVHEQVAGVFLPRLVDHLANSGVTLKAEPRAYALIGQQPAVEQASAEDFDTEWMALICGVKVVSGLDEAIDHIETHSMGHSDGILSTNPEAIARFLNEVNSAAVFVNASTRFNDGGALGLGAELAVSTQKLHTRGPMALEGMTTYKWIVEGDGTIRV